MSIALLDVNILMALSWAEHVHSQAARKWFAGNRKSGWATCPLTQAAYVRLSIQPTVVGARLTFAQAMEALQDHCRDPFHHFFPHASGLTDIMPEMLQRITGHQQIADAILLDIAIRNRARLATFDGRIRSLLPKDSPHHDALVVVPVE